jgi:peptidoglycan/LPS O-acetylase OafA/YrhL
MKRMRIPFPEHVPINGTADKTVGGLSSKTHLAAMDGVRGLAILGVLLFHGTVGSTQAKGIVLLALGEIVRLGWMGVDLFFALSGFLITGILLDTTHDPNYFSTFYLRRALRIFPLYYGILLTLAVLTLPLAIQWHGTAPYFLLYLQNYIFYGRLTLATSLVPIHIEHFWSLAVEEQFYLIWPALVWLFRRSSNFIVIPLVLVVACPIARYMCFHPGSFMQPAYIWTPFRADALAWGAIAAWLARYRPRWGATIGAILMVSGSLGVALVALHAHGFDQYDLNVIRFGYTSTGALFCGLLLRILVPGSTLTKMTSNGLLRWLGKYSYGIYVYHYMFINMYSAARHYVVAVTGSKGLGAAAYLLSLLLTGTVAAYISYNVFERKWLLLKGRVAPYTMQGVDDRVPAKLS